MKRKPKKSDSGVDWLIRRVVESAQDVVTRSAQKVRETEELRQISCLLLIDGSDPIARAYYEHCLQAGMRGPPLKQHVITTFIEPYDAIMEVAAVHYLTQGHVEAPLAPGEVRAVVLTLGTLTVVQLGARSTARAASKSYRTLHPDVLLMALACWRNDHPDGFLIRAIFKTRQQGEAFMARYHAQRAEIEGSRPTKAVLEEQLVRFKPVYGKGRVPLDVQARLYAQVGWLEDSSQLPDDRFNGLQFTYGCQIDLYAAGEMVREQGGPSDDLS